MSDKYPITVEPKHSPREIQAWASNPDLKLILKDSDFPYLPPRPVAELETDAKAIRATQLEFATIFAPNLEKLDASKLVLGRNSFVPNLKESNILGHEDMPNRKQVGNPALAVDASPLALIPKGA
jgi:hypothetical protein